MLKWLLFVLFCVFVFAFPHEARVASEWVLWTTVDTILVVRDAIGLPVPTPNWSPC